MARGGKGGHTSHRQPSRPHAGDRRLAGLVRRSVRPGEVPTMGGAASIGRGGGGGSGRKLKGIPLRDIGKLRKGRQMPDVTSRELGRVSPASGQRLQEKVRVTRVQKKVQARLKRDRKVRDSLNPVERDLLSTEKRRSLGRLMRSLEQRFIETFPQTRRK